MTRVATLPDGRRFGLGYRRNTRHTRIAFGACLFTAIAAAAVMTPPAVDLSPVSGPVLDQGQTGSCTGHGTSTGLYTSCAYARAPIGFVPSPRGIYQNGRAAARIIHADGAFDPLTDDGAEPAQVLRAIQAWGVRKMGPMATDGRMSDCDPETINDEPSLLEVEEEALTLPVGERGIQSCDEGAKVADVVQAMRLALAAGMAVAAGNFVDSNFMSRFGTEPPMGATDTNDPNGGGHWFCFVGYRTEANGATSFLLKNSWGLGWGAGGFTWVSAAFIAQCSDLTVYVAQIRKAAA